MAYGVITGHISGSVKYPQTVYSVYGISRDTTSSSPAWVRTDDSVGMTAAGSVGTTAGKNDFNDTVLYSKIVRETLDTGDVMVKIPRFYYKRYMEGTIEHIKITYMPRNGFTLHPAFNHGGVETDCIYVGAYKTSSNNKSVSGATPQGSQTRATRRTNARAKGSGWGLIDASSVSAIQMLFLVEFATYDSQSALGRGVTNVSGKINTGSCDTVANLNGRASGTDGNVDIVYRGIEGIWGNVWEMVDGINIYNDTYYVCNDPSKYTDNTSNNYEELSYKGVQNISSSSYIKKLGLDNGNNDHIMLPNANGGSSDTYICDHMVSSSGWRIVIDRGSSGDNYGAGLFAGYFKGASDATYSDTGSRLMYIPQGGGN